MSPVSIAINTINRAVASFHPAAMPRLSRGHYRRELAAWFFLPIMLGSIEGGVVGVVAKNTFAGAVEPRLLNFAVAVLTGAPAFANVLSFAWAALSHGRHKIRFLVGLQIATAALVAAIALAPRNAIGILVLTFGVVGARVCWSGVITLRSTVWRVNYPRSDRATLAGKLATVQAIMLTGIGVVVGLAMRYQPDAFRVIYPAAAALGLVGTWFYSGLRMRGHRALVRAEREAGEETGRRGHGLEAFSVLRTDRRFRGYMLCMFLFGTGNLMVSAPLVILLRDRFGLDIFRSILITSSIPTLIMPLTIPLWSRLLDGTHIIRFRAVHSWTFVVATTMFLLGALTLQPWLLFVGAVAKGAAFGGGVLGWNLGHHDFAPRERASDYMGVHVTLTGVRGIIAPVVALLIYEVLEATRPGSGSWVLAVCLVLTLAGAIVFNVMARRMNRG